MEISEIRMRNYKSLLLMFRDRPDQAGLPEHGLFTRFAEKAGVSARYLSHINNDRKNIGTATARRMEEGFNLPVGWMDNDHEGNSDTLTAAEREHVATSLKLFRESPIEAQAVLMQYMLGRLGGTAKIAGAVHSPPSRHQIHASRHFG